MTDHTELIERARDSARQAGHYGAWSGGVLLNEIADALEQSSRENSELRAHVERLREALIYHQEQTRPITKTIEALAATPAQSLAAERKG